GQSQVRMRLSQLRLLCKDFLQGRNGFGRLIPREFQTPSEVETWDFSAAAFEDLVNNGCRLVPLVLLQEELCQLLFGFYRFGIEGDSVAIDGGGFVSPLASSVEAS